MQDSGYRIQLNLRMHCTLLINNLPERTSPALETLLARGETVTRNAGIHNVNENTSDALLCKLFGVAKQQDYPTAAICAARDGIAVGDGYWLHATPVYLQPDRSRVLLADVPNDVTFEENRALADALNAHFAQDGLTFHAAHHHIYLNAKMRAGIAPGLTTTPLEQVVGRNIDTYLPQGDGWLRIFNEAQMILHAHPVNELREVLGALPVNSLWFWGGGILPNTGIAYDLVASDDGIAAALAHSTKTLHIPLPIDAGIWLASTQSKNALITLEPASDDVSLIEHWCASLYVALRAKRISNLKLITRDDKRVIEADISARQAKHWWKRTKPLSSYQA